jgi:predicted nuclease of restriction endonuclease-like RecB superfamily
LLPKECLSYELAGARVLPEWLGSRDEAWVREVGERVARAVGGARADVTRPLEYEAARLARKHGRKASSGRAVLRVLLQNRAWTPAVDVDARALRMFVWEQERGEAVAAAARRFEIDEDAVVPAMFADLPARRLLQGAEDRLAPAQVVMRHNLWLAQGLLLRAARLEIAAGQHARPIVRYAKLLGLLVAGLDDPNGFRLEILGPLALIHKTRKYGAALARLLGAVTSVPEWTLDATLSMDEGPCALRLDASDPLERAHALPRETDSKLERQLLADFGALASRWTLAREGVAIRLGSRFAFPDFVARAGPERVLVEVLGFPSPDYLARKTAQYANCKLPVVFCAQASLPIPEGPWSLIRFERRIPAAEVLAALERTATC